MNKTSSRQTLWTILFVAFLDNLSVGILLPLVPLLLTSHQTGLSLLPAGMTDAQGYVIFGWLLASYTIAQFVSTPILGDLSDRHGRKLILSLSLLGTCLAYLLFGYGVLTHNLPLLFISRILDGITGGNISVAQAVIADITEPKARAKTYGLFGGALGVGFAIGPIIGSFFSNSSIVSWFNATTPFWLTAGLALLSAGIVTIFLSETAITKTDNAKFNPLDSLIAIGNAFKLREARTLFTAIFVWRTGFAFWTTFGAVFLIYRFNLNQSQLGSYFLFVGLWLILCQIFFVRLITRWLSSIQMVTLSIFSAGLIFLIYLIPHNWQTLFWIVPFIASSTALTLANVPAVVSQAAGSHNQGQYSGMSNSVQALALSIAPILSGYISASLSPISVVAISSLLMIMAGFVFLFYQRSHILS